MSHLRSASLWASAILMVLIPFVLVVDLGGRWYWSHYVTSFAILAATVLALPGLTDSTASSGLAQHKFMLPILGLAVYAWFQTIPLSPGIVATLSPGTHTAYTSWIEGVVPAEQLPNAFPISISRTDSLHVVAMLSLLLPLAFAASVVFHARSRLTMLLSSIALAGASVAVLGIFRKLNPHLDLWFYKDFGTAFGGFINRNNAALMLNLGMAASLGLLSWRTMILHNIELDHPEFELNDLVALVSDRDSFIGLFSAAACAAGLLINGSRGGFVAALFGLAFAFGYARPSRGLVSFPVLAVIVALSVGILTVPLQLNLDTIRRMEVLTPDADTIQRERGGHWMDGWSAAKEHFPLGSGFSTYSYAYLPFQQTSSVSGSTFVHADNLWLELLVEAGLPGICVLVGMVVILVVSMRRLAASHDPIDQGLRVAGWYAMAAVFVSQCFDFGLINGANFIVATLLACAMTSRDIANGGAAVFETVHDEDAEDEKKRSPKIRLMAKTKRNWLSPSLAGPVILAGVVLACAGSFVDDLRIDAETQSTALRLEREYVQWCTHPEAMKRMEAELARLDALRFNPEVRFHLAAAQEEQGQLTEIIEWRPANLEHAGSIRSELLKVPRQLPYPPTPMANRTAALKSIQHYRRAWTTSVATLVGCPLARAPRVAIVRLKDMVSEKDEWKRAFTQLTQLYGMDTRRIVTLGKIAIQRDEWDLAASALHGALVRNPNLTSTVMPLLSKHPSLDIEKAIPKDPVTTRLASNAMLQWDEPNLDYLREAKTLIPDGETSSLSQRSGLESLLGEIHFRLNENDEAIERYLQAIRLTPDNTSLRLQLVEHLLRLDRRKEALAQARVGRQSAPDNPRFQQIIDQIAESDRQSVLQEDSTEKSKRAALEAILD